MMTLKPAVDFENQETLQGSSSSKSCGDERVVPCDAHFSSLGTLEFSMLVNHMVGI